MKHAFFFFSTLFSFFLTFTFTPLAAHSAICSLNPSYAYKAPNSSVVYYITEKCTKRAFTNANIFFTYFPSWGAVEGALASLLKSTPDDPLGFMPYGPLYDPKYGALVKIVDDPKVYLLLGGEKYWITSEEVFSKLGYQWNWIEDIDKRLLDKYQTGSEITYTDRHPNFTLVKYAGSPKVYRLEPGFAEATPDKPGSSEAMLDKDGFTGKTVKRHITDEAVFAQLGFRLDRIVTIPQSETYLDGAALTGSDAPLPISVNIGSGTVVEKKCESNPNPVFTHMIVDPARIININPPPNIAKVGNALKTHSYIDTDALGIPIYAPVDMEFFNGAHYVGGPYTLDFRVSCEVKVRLAHIDPVQKIKNTLPKDPAPKNDSRNQEVSERVAFKAGEIVAYVYQDEGVLSTGLDFGVYHSERPNRYAESSDPHIKQSEIYTTAVCPYDFFTDELKSAYRSKYNLIIPEGMIKQLPSFCD